MNYQQQALAGATGMDLIVALYDGLTRFLHHARECTVHGDVSGRRLAVKRAVDIIIYLQARLRFDTGGAPAAALADFYAAMFTLTLEASHDQSVQGFDEVLACIANVRDAWSIVARDPEAARILPRELRTSEERSCPGLTPHHACPAHVPELPSHTARWSA